MTRAAQYEMPTGIVGLSGPVKKPAPGTIPLRGDLAHIALAQSYLAAHYVIPHMRRVGDKDVSLKLAPRDDADNGAMLAAGSDVELLDCEGAWVWLAAGPEGPSGYAHADALVPIDAE